MPGPGPSQTGLVSSSVGPYASDKYWDATAGGAVPVDFSTSKTLILLVELVSLVTQIPWLYADGPTGGNKGWYFSFNSSGAFSLVLQGGSGSQSITTGLKAGNYLCVAITHTAAGAVRYSLNGLPVVQTIASAVYVPVDAATQHLVGRAPSGEGFSSVAACTGMNVIAMAWRKAASSDADLVAFSNGPNTVDPARLPAAVNTAIVADGGFIAYPHTDWDGVTTSWTAGVGSDLPTWTRITNTPVKNAIDAYARYETANIPEVWNDNQRFDVFGGYYQHDYLGRIMFQSSATEVMVGAVFNNVGVVNSNNIGLVVDGVNQLPHGLHAIGFDQIEGSGIRYAGLAGGVKTFQLLEGYKNRIPTDPPNNWTGVYQQWFQVPAAASFDWILPSAPSKRLFVLGDSMSDKINPTTFITSPTYQTWTRLLRDNAPAHVKVAVMAASGAGLLHYAGAVGDTTTFNALLALILANLDGTSENIFLLELGINDWSQNLQTLANYTTVYNQLIDAVHAAGKPGFKFIALGPTQVIAPASPVEPDANPSGYTLQDIRDANEASCIARSGWARYIGGNTLISSGPGAGLPGSDYGGDGVHMNVAPDGVGNLGGHLNYYNGLISVAPELFILITTTQIIVGKRWPHPRWFVADNTPPVGFDQVIADGDDVIADLDDVIAPS